VLGHPRGPAVEQLAHLGAERRVGVLEQGVHLGRVGDQLADGAQVLPAAGASACWAVSAW
jgi:hypothetical protein